MRKCCWLMVGLLLMGLMAFSLAQAEGEILAAQSERLALYFTDDYLKFRLVDLQSGKEWFSYMQDDQVPQGTRVNRTWNNRSQSLALVHYTDAVAATGEVSSADLTAQDKVVTAEPLENGLRITYELTKLELTFALDFVLDGDDLVVTVPFDCLQENGKNVWTGLSLLPFLGTTNDWDEGYILYPNDCGELFYYKDQQYRSNALVTLTLPVYAPHITQKRGFPLGVEAQVREDLTTNTALLPAFGVKDGDNGFAAVVEKGDEDCDIIVTPAGVSLPVNRVYAKLTYRTNYGTRGQQVNVGGSTQLSYVSVLTDREIRPGDRVVRYTFLNGKEADYAGMAQAVRRSYVERGRLKPLETAPDVVLDVFCAIEQQLVLTREYMSFTTFEQAGEMVQYFLDEGYDNLHVNLKGWGDRGMLGYPLYTPASSELGGDRGLRALASLCQQAGVELLLQVNPMKLRKDNGGFQAITNTARDGNDYVYNIDSDGRSYYLQNLAMVKRNLTEWQRYAEQIGATGFTYEDIGAYLFDDFTGEKTMRSDYAAFWRSQLGVQDAVVGGNASMLENASMLREVPEQSSLFHFGDESVPFYQMVLHGSVAYTGQPINLFYDDTQQVLRMIEYGYTPCFELTHESVSRLSATDYALLFSARFSSWSDEIHEYAYMFQEVAEKVGSRAFTDHRQLAEGVYESTFEDVRIIVNYNQEAYGDVPPGSYSIVTEEE